MSWWQRHVAVFIAHMQRNITKSAKNVNKKGKMRFLNTDNKSDQQEGMIAWPIYACHLST